MSGEDDILYELRGPVALVTLNRPEALNALTLAMCRELDGKLAQWQDDPAVAAVVMQGAGERAYCAGGDVVAIYESGRGDGAVAAEFFRAEYRLDRRIFHFPKPFVALIDGIVMGGGVGISVHGSHRVGGDATIFAMPETGIGFYPDVGGTYFLPRLPGHLGEWMGLTGARLKDGDAFAAGLAQLGARQFNEGARNVRAPGVNGVVANLQSRVQVGVEAVEERERGRVRALCLVVAGLVPGEGREGVDLLARQPLQSVHAVDRGAGPRRRLPRRRPRTRHEPPDRHRHLPPRLRHRPVHLELLALRLRERVAGSRVEERPPERRAHRRLLPVREEPVAEAAGVDPTSWTSVDDMFADMDQVKAAGYNFMAMGGNTFQAGYLFHALVAGVAGPDIFYRFYRGTPDESVFDEQGLRDAIETFRRMLELSAHLGVDGLING